MANQGTIITIVAIISILLLGAFFQDKYDIFSVTGSEGMTRNLPTEVSGGSSVQVTYSVSGASGRWGASVVDVLSCPGMANQEKQFVMISDEGTTKILSYNMPTGEGVQCTLAGNFKFGDKDTTTFSTKITTTEITTISHTEKRCDSGNVYWYNSLGVREEIFEACADGCSNAQCNICNTDFDTNCDGSVDRGELGEAILDWLEEDISRNKLGEAISAWSENE